MEMPRLVPEHKALDLFVGRWLGNETLHPSLFDSVGGPALGRAFNRLGLEGFAVIQDYEQEKNGKVNYRGHGIFLWDGVAKTYFLHWFDSMGFPPVVFRGRREQSVFIFEAQTPGGWTRATFDFSVTDAYRFVMEMSPDGKNWAIFTEGEYARQ
jgi:hypothetical protein